MPIVFNSSASATFAENGNGVVRDIDASLNGASADSGLTYSITDGADQALFTVDANTGELRFQSAPDFETPTDAGTDNIYNVTVTATDGSETDTQALTITVIDDGTIELAALDGSDGFVINGIDGGDGSGQSVSSAGDVNGDGFDDIIISAPNADTPTERAGEVYVVFGKASGFTGVFGLSSLDGSNGFVLTGTNTADETGASVSAAGDVNGDGFDDIIIGAPGVDPSGQTSAGESYVVLGQANFSSTVGLSGLSGTTGYTLSGLGAGDTSGTSVSSAGDINNDGFSDVIIGAPNGDSVSSNSGESYVLLGSASGLSTIGALNGSNGFIVNGVELNGGVGRSVSFAGDVNGDGVDDFVIGADGTDAGGTTDAGQSYVVFGQTSAFGASFDLTSLDGTNGFAINGISGFDRSGRSVSSAGDVNGDGFDDILIGARFADPNGSETGESYVIFGKSSGFGASFDLSTLDGSNGFVINGVTTGDQSGSSVAAAGDINGDGFDDILIGANNADPNGTSSGQAYVLTGKASGFSSSVELSNFNDSNGFVIDGLNAGDQFGVSVSGAGDINNDGFDDILIGAVGASPDTDTTTAGASYLIFGSASLGKSIQFTSNQTFNFAENGTGAVVDVNASLNGGSADTGLTYSLTGGADQSLFSIDSATGVLTFAAAPDFEAPGDAGNDNVYDVTVVATASGSVSSSQDITVAVTGVNDAPVIAVPTINITEDTIDAPIPDTLDITDDEGDDLTVTITATGGTISVATSGLSFTSGDGTDDTSFTFSSTIQPVGVALDSLTFTPTPNLSGSNVAMIRIQVDDGNGGLDDESIPFGILGVNDVPTLLGAPTDVITTEDTASDFDLSSVTLADDDNEPLTVTLSAPAGAFTASSSGGVVVGGTNSASITLSGTASAINTYLDTSSNIQYTGITDASGDNVSSYTINVNDGTVNPQLASGNIDITNVDDPSVIDGIVSGSVTEGNVGDSPVTVSGTLTINDVDTGDTPSFNNVPLSVGDFGLGSFELVNGTWTFNLDQSAVQNLSQGSTATDTFTFTATDGNTQQVTITVNGTDETISVPAPPTPVGVTPFVVNNDDSNTSADALTGTSADDIVEAGGGDDTVSGGDGEDRIDGGTGNDIIAGGAGEDTLEGGSGSDRLDGGAGSDVLGGGLGDDILFGGDGDDIIIAGVGNDISFAGLGDTGDDTVDGGSGSDILGAGAGNDNIDAGDGDDVVYANFGNDNVDGGAGDDLLFGGAGDDTIDGGAGSDEIWAGIGNDTLTGGEGKDTFTFIAGFEDDTISDFSTSDSDILNLSEITGLSLDSVQSSATFRGGDTILNLDGHGILTLTGIDADEFQEMIANDLIAVE